MVSGRTSQFYFARDMRKNITDEEFKFWCAIKEQPRAHGRWRRQVLFGKYIADFCCHEYRLIVEIDGAHHDVDKDDTRDAFLVSEGYKVLRYSNQNINSNITSVIEDVLPHINPHPNLQGQIFASPHLSRRRNVHVAKAEGGGCSS